MKLLISSTYYLPYVSGMTVYIQRLVGVLKKDGYEIEILTSQYDKTLRKDETLSGIKITRVPYLLRLSKGLIMPNWLFLGFKKVMNSDLTMCHFPQAEGIWLLLFGKFLRKKTILVFQCDVKLPKGLLNYIVEKFLTGLNFVSCCLADKIVSSSEDYAKNSPVLSRFLNKVEIIYPPIKDFSLLKVSVEEKRELDQKMTGAKIKIGFVGRISADKGIEYLLEAIPFLREKFNNFKIFLVGSSEAVGEKDYVKKIELLKNEYKDDVVFFGQISEEALVYFYKNIDVLVFPSINSTEAFGMVQVEAMLAGVPVVASELPGIRVPIRLSNMGELIQPKDSKLITEAIGRILKNKIDYKKSKSDMERIFSLKKTVDGYERLFI